MAFCNDCFRHCELQEGQAGPCGARAAKNGRVEPLYYGRISSLALDPIEKKSLNQFHPGSMILSVGSLGCNLRCPFCQNHEIAQRDGPDGFAVKTETMSPERLADLATYYIPSRNIGVAFTYNEPLVCWEYVRDTARLVHRNRMLNVMVTNGTANLDILNQLLPYIDAMNIDLKGFTDRYYREVLGGDRQTVMSFIQEAVKRCHVELTTLIVPGENDNEDEITALAAWVAGLKNVQGGKQGREIPLHVTRFFPRHRMTDRSPTDVTTICSLVQAARKHLLYVYPGNV